MNSTAIESKLIRKGGSIIPIGNTEYHFAPYTDGAHVCEVANEEHADRFLSITEGYRLYRGAGKPVDGKSTPTASAGPTQEQRFAEAMASLPAAAPINEAVTVTASAPEILLGGDFPASFDIHGATYALGDIVARAHTASGLAADAWNALPDDERDAKIEAELDRIAAAGVQPVATPPVAEDRAALAAEYERLYGKKPHHNTGIDKLRELIAAKQ